MQIGQDWKIKNRNPGLLLWSVLYNFQAWIRPKGQQLALNGVVFSNIKTKKFTIGAVGVAGCDFNFTSAANTTEQVFNLGAVIPALARVLDVKAHTSVAFTAGATTLVAEIGNASSGNQFVASATILAADAIIAMANAAALNVVPNKAATSVYVAITPGANWSTIVAGKLDVYITYIETAI